MLYLTVSRLFCWLRKLMRIVVLFTVSRIKNETGTSIIIPSNTVKSNIIRIEGSPQGVEAAKNEILMMAKKLVSIM